MINYRDACVSSISRQGRYDGLSLPSRSAAHTSQPVGRDERSIAGSLGISTPKKRLKPRGQCDYRLRNINSVNDVEES